jgi:PAS domain S-box-containing protein
MPGRRDKVHDAALAVARLGTFDWDLASGSVVLDQRSREIFGLESDEDVQAKDIFSRIDPRDYPRVRARIEAAAATLSRLEIEYRVQLPDGTSRVVASISDAVPGPDGRAERFVGVFVDATKRRQVEAALRESEARFRHMADSAPALILMTDDQAQVIFANMHHEHMFGRPVAEMLGTGWRKVVHPDDLADVERRFHEAFSARRPFRAEIRVCDRDNNIRWVRFDGVSRLDDGQRFLGYTICGIDITDARIAEERRELLMHELNHRVKNTLATVQSLVRQTLRSSSNPEDALQAVESRLLALSRVHDILTREYWEGAWLEDIVSQALRPFHVPGDGRLNVAGPAVRLPSHVTLALSMAFQELATNAVKYGAWSNDTGQVRLTWAVDRTGPVPYLEIRWEEQGGPAVGKPARRGFGSKLIEHGLASDFGGGVQIDYLPAGVVCTIRAALQS